MDTEQPVETKPPAEEANKVYLGLSQNLKTDALIIYNATGDARMYRASFHRKNTKYYRCSRCDTIRRRRHEGEVAKLKVVDGVVSGNKFPRHNPECVPLRYEEVQALMLDRSARREVKGLKCNPKDAWQKGFERAIELASSSQAPPGSRLSIATTYPSWQRVRKSYTSIRLKRLRRAAANNSEMKRGGMNEDEDDEEYMENESSRRVARRRRSQQSANQRASDENAAGLYVNATNTSSSYRSDEGQSPNSSSRLMTPLETIDVVNSDSDTERNTPHRPSAQMSMRAASHHAIKSQMPDQDDEDDNESIVVHDETGIHGTILIPVPDHPPRRNPYMHIPEQPHRYHLRQHHQQPQQVAQETIIVDNSGLEPEQEEAEEDDDGMEGQEEESKEAVMAAIGAHPDLNSSSSSMTIKEVLAARMGLKLTNDRRAVTRNAGARRMQLHSEIQMSNRNRSLNQQYDDDLQQQGSQYSDDTEMRLELEYKMNETISAANSLIQRFDTINRDEFAVIGETVADSLRDVSKMDVNALAQFKFEIFDIITKYRRNVLLKTD